MLMSKPDGSLCFHSSFGQRVLGRLDDTSERTTQFDSKIGCGLLWPKGLNKPYAGIDLINNTRSHRIGVRMTIESAMEYDIEFEVEQQREAD